MVELKGSYRPVLVLLLLLLVSCLSAQEENFEELDWELLYPEEILTDASAQIDISSGFFLSGEPAIGAFVRLNPRMHFLIFDGVFNVLVEQREDEFGNYFQLANQEVSDYFDSTRVKYKNLIFRFGLGERLNSSMVFLPRVDFNRKYIHFDYDYQNWRVDVKSPEWSSWAFDLSTPSWKAGRWGFKVNADAFVDNSSSITYALSAGPALVYQGLEISPFVGYEHFGIQTDKLEAYDPIFDDGTDAMVYGLMGAYEKGVLSLRAGVKKSLSLSPFFTVQVGPLEMSGGKALFLAHENPGRRSWTDVYWNLETDNYDTRIGFSYETDIQNTSSQSFVADFKVRVYENLFMDIRLMKKEEWLFMMGARYHFNLDFYE